MTEAKTEQERAAWIEGKDRRLEVLSEAPLVLATPVPLMGSNGGTEQFTIPQRSIRLRLTELPDFLVNRGGEYCFIPSLSALRWLSELDT